MITNVVRQRLTVSRLQRGDATRNSTGNTKIPSTKPIVKLSRTASDSRRGQGTEISFKSQSRIRNIRSQVKCPMKKEQELKPQQNTAMTSLLRVFSDMMQKQNEKEVLTIKTLTNTITIVDR